MIRLIDAKHLIKKAEKEKNDGLLEDDELETIYYELSDEPAIDAVPVEWIKEWVEEIKDHPAYTEKEKILCIEEFEDMLGAWAEERNDVYVTLHHDDINFKDEKSEKAFYDALAERKEE